MFSRTVKFSHRALGLAALLGLLPAAALAAPPQGEWRGLVQQANTDVAVTVRFNAQGASIHFNDPLSCDVPARFLKADGAATIYRFAVSVNGGRFCDGLLNRSLTVTPASNRLKITFDTARTAWHGELSPVATTTP